MIKTILVPVDFSDGARAALREAAALASRCSAQLVVLHVDEFPATDTGDMRYLPRHVVEDHERWLKHKMASFLEEASAAGCVVREAITHGYVHQAILDAARDVKADLIVIGSHGRSGIRRIMMGSVAERVVRSAEVPVMTVRSLPGASCTVAEPGEAAAT